ncbi:hypothetical protein BDZ45DRAFT_240473 [Acephala macrosclerotiorum]|nr:hypothetical protein BDZ45DRAFT_240473 [Acephala macrosclerotiorum]
MEVKFTSRAEAEAHIAKIRHDKGLLEGSPSGPNVSDLENALTTLSEQLYQSSTHFLLELIQNADDNTYDPKLQPSVHFTYANGNLRLDCNEVGFSPRNVEALCRVGQSTKKGFKGGDPSTRYVGEKGIGFKSVFKAADVVWISSGNYSFKFDKSKQLGMIAPIWDDFPAPVKPGFTSLYLQLSENYNRRGLVQELKALDSRLLIFLRRLRSITVSITERIGLIHKTWNSTFSSLEMGKNLTRLIQNGKVCDYIITRHQVPNMPRESKREGVTSSEIILGFPITEDNQPKRESQQAYAFLPIRDYGFEFLIQADFLLVASREDIDDSAEWNHTLRNALSTAFIDSMKEFNKGDLRYFWPRYLPTREPLQSFLQPFHHELWKNLEMEPILFSQSGDLTAPKSLTYVPEKYTFSGAPLTISTKTSSRYLSGRYLESGFEYLKVLGVAEMTEFKFFDELSTMTRLASEEFKKKSNAWHSHLASILLTLGPSNSTQLADLTIVPLDNGTWIQSKNNQILFPSNRSEFELPGGLELHVVHPDAASDPIRQRFLKSLGVGDLEHEPVARHIEELHKSNRAGSSSVTRTALISQIEFLYSTEWKNPRFQQFWFTSESNVRLHGSKLYQESSKPYSASHFFGAHRKTFHFIHHDYVRNTGKDREAWSRWLEEKMEVATMPRLVEPTTDRGFIMSDDFKFIIKNFPSSDVLLLLRDNWEDYSRYFDPDKMSQWKDREEMTAKYDAWRYVTSATKLREKLGSMLVTCTNGKKHRLDATFLPSKELLVASQDGVPFVEIPEPNNSSWQVFETLGVSIKVDISFYLRCVERLEGSGDGTRVEKLLDLIQLRCNSEADASLVKKLFADNKMVCIPATKEGKPHQWVSLSQCRWKGPPIEKDTKDFRTFNVLKDIYPENKRLFCDILGVKNATLNDLVLEARKFTVGDSLAHITSMFHSMEKFLEEENAGYYNANLYNLQAYGIFPVSKNWNLDTDRVSAMQNGLKSSEWFIADTATFRTIFAGVVPLLDIKVDHLAQMDQLLGKLGLKSRLLTEQAKSVPKIQGVVALNQELTNLFRSKVDFFIRLIPTKKTQRKRRLEVIQQLRNLQVYTADEVIQEWSVTYKGKTLKGPPGNGQVALQAEDDVLKIFLAAKSGIEMDQTPMELVDELFNFCGMVADNPKHSEMCLHIALSQKDLSIVSKVFADKGIPSIEGLRFADVIESEEEDGKGPMAKKDWKDEKGEGSGGARMKDRFRDFSVAAGAVLVFPVGIVIGLGSLVKRKKCFDGEEDDDEPKEKTKVKKVKEKVKSKEKKPKVSKPGTGTSSRQSGFNTFQKSVSQSWLRLCSTDEDVAFKGEFTVHKVLAETLGQNYNPRQHWTSIRRAKAKFPAFHPKNNAAFVFSDTSGSFTQLLASHEFPTAKNWITRPPTYHIDVKATRGDLKSEFVISQQEFERARELSIMMQRMNGDGEEGVPKNVYILVRVHGVDVLDMEMEDDGKGKGKGVDRMAVLVDPWEYYHADKLKLRSKGQLFGRVV